MKCQIFSSHNLHDLKEKINAWLEKHPELSSGSIDIHFTSVQIDDPYTQIVEHTLILFYVPMEAL